MGEVKQRYTALCDRGYKNICVYFMNIMNNIQLDISHILVFDKIVLLKYDKSKNVIL